MKDLKGRVARLHEIEREVRELQRQSDAEAADRSLINDYELDDAMIRSIQRERDRGLASADELNVLASMLADRGRIGEALEIACEGIAIDPQDEEIHELRGRLLARLDLPDAAAAALEKAIELDPSRPHVHVYLAQIYMRQGQVQSAVAVLEKACEAVPDSKHLPFLLGLARVIGGEGNHNLPAIEKAVALSSDQHAAGGGLPLVLPGSVELKAADKLCFKGADAFWLGAWLATAADLFGLVTTGFME